MLGMVNQAGGSVMGFDWRIHLDEARKIFGYGRPVQGNMDPVSLFMPMDVLKKKVHEVVNHLKMKTKKNQ